MAFWGVEVKTGQSLDVKVDRGSRLHLRQVYAYFAALTKKVTKILSTQAAKVEKTEAVVSLEVTVGEKKYLLATLLPGMMQEGFHLSFGTDFQISHNSKNGSIFFYGLEVRGRPSRCCKFCKRKFETQDMVTNLSLPPSATTEFWGAEIKSGQSFDVKLDQGMHLYLRQVSVAGFDEKTDESVQLKVTDANGKIKSVYLYPKEQPQLVLYMELDKHCQITHDLQNGSVFLLGKMKDPSYKHDVCDVCESDKHSDDVSRPRLSPTIEQCMAIVTRFPGFDEGSWDYMQALRVFLKKPARENFMVPKSDKTRIKFLEMLIQEDPL